MKDFNQGKGNLHQSIEEKKTRKTKTQDIFFIIKTVEL